MRFTEIRVQNFRNIDFASIPIDSNTFFYGENGQGKTNILEAFGFITALRSFRTYNSEPLIKNDQPSAAIYYKVEHEREGDCIIRIDLYPNRKVLYFNDQAVQKMSEIIGQFPTVAFTSEDAQLINGAPLLRRQVLDLTLATSDPDYLRALQRYSKALKERNALLRSKNISHGILDAFNTLLAQEALILIKKRTAFIQEISLDMIQYYNAISQTEETPLITYKPNVICDSINDFLGILKKNQERDTLLQSTQKGPHKDDLFFQIQSNKAKYFASEGQSRTFVIALRLAQVKYLEKKTGIRPVILADDILGPLDSNRRNNFWKSLDGSYQILATGTEPQSVRDLKNWQLIEVSEGGYALNNRDLQMLL